MSKLLKSILLLSGLLGVIPAHAALSVRILLSVTFSANNVTSGTDAVVVLITNGNGLSVSDNLNGSYTTAYQAAPNSQKEQFSFVHATSTGKPTVTVSNPGAGYIEVSVCDITGFAGTPTVDTSVNAGWFSATSTTAVSGSPITTGHNSEMLFWGQNSSSFNGGGGGWASAPTGWTTQAGPNDGGILTGYVATSGTSNNMSGTLNTAVTWAAITTGIYDAGGSSTRPNQMFLGM